jgi:hypothetical protein
MPQRTREEVEERVELVGSLVGIRTPYTQIQKVIKLRLEQDVSIAQISADKKAFQDQIAREIKAGRSRRQAMVLSSVHELIRTTIQNYQQATRFVLTRRHIGDKVEEVHEEVPDFWLRHRFLALFRDAIILEARVLGVYQPDVQTGPLGNVGDSETVVNILQVIQQLPDGDRQQSIHILEELARKLDAGRVDNGGELVVEPVEIHPQTPSEVSPEDQPSLPRSGD